ncbi:MAG TPA: hypothetical protein VJT16_13165 [Streptosporangiaceae bacterium]|nr:hypothetical protein [Streptosporangiaceae bacterium]
MAATQTGTSVAGDGQPPEGRRRFRGWGILATVLAFSLAAAAVVLGVVAEHYQPLVTWNEIGGFPDLHRAANVREVNTFARDGDLYIPHQHRIFAAPVSLFNSGSFTVTIEAVSLRPPHPGGPWALVPAGPALYWTGRMMTGSHPKHGKPIAGLALKPGVNRGIFIAVPVRTPKCYLSRAFQILDSFFVRERFGPFDRWVRIPLHTSLILNAPQEPANEPGPGVVCGGG